MSGSVNQLYRDPLPGEVSSPNPLIQGAPTWADAAQWHAQNLADTWTAMQNPQTWTDAARQYGSAMLMGTTAPGIKAPGITAFHGSPHDFDAFDASKIGTGEGAQAYGHGLYFAENPGVAQSYRDQLATASTPEQTAAVYLQAYGGRDAAMAKLQGAIDYGLPTADLARVKGAYELLNSGAPVAPAHPGRMYEVNLAADPQHFLDWDKTVGTHPDPVRDKLLDLGYGDADRGADVYSHMSGGRGGPEAATAKLNDAGIPGIKYLDQGSRGSGQGTSNYVVFNPSIISIMRKYAVPLGVLSGTGAGLIQQDQ